MMYCVSYTTVRIDSAEILSVQLPAKRSAAAIGLDQNHHPWDVDKKVPKHIPAAEARRKTGRKMGAKMGREEERPPSQAAPASLHSLSLSLPTGDGEGGRGQFNTGISSNGPSLSVRLRWFGPHTLLETALRGPLLSPLLSAKKSFFVSYHLPGFADG